MKFYAVVVTLKAPWLATREADPLARPRVIADQGSQFKSREFKAFIAQWQASHVMISPFYSQSNG